MVMLGDPKPTTPATMRDRLRTLAIIAAVAASMIGADRALAAAPNPDPAPRLDYRAAQVATGLEVWAGQIVLGFDGDEVYPPMAGCVRRGRRPYRYRCALYINGRVLSFTSGRASRRIYRNAWAPSHTYARVVVYPSGPRRGGVAFRVQEV